MSILAWVISGVISGLVASWMVNKNYAGLIVNLALGVAGALIGGSLFNTLGTPTANSLNLYSVMVAWTAAVALLVAYHILFPPMRSG